jgi:hypothetical protein
VLTLAIGSFAITDATRSAAAAPAKPRLVGVEHAPGFASDGARYAAFNASATKVRVFDGRTGKLCTIKTKCSLVAGAGGHFLVDCGDRAGDVPAPALLDVRTHTVSPIPGADPPYDGFYDMGTQWLVGNTYDPAADPADPGSLLYLNWHTGQRVERPRSEQSAPNRDVDSPSLATIGGIPFSSYLLFGFERPWSAVRPLGASAPGALQLVSGSRRKVLSRTPCEQECGEVSTLAGGRLAWAEPAKHGVRVSSYVLRGRHRVSWVEPGPFPDAGRPVRRVEVSQTAKYVVYARLTRLARDPASGDLTPSRYRVYAARR